MDNLFKMHGMRPTRAGFGEGILDSAIQDSRLIGLGLDITASVGLDLFAKAFPERFFSFGIAEQNAMAVATGLALSGKIPVLSTYGVFIAFRSADQLRISVCYNNVHVIIGGAHAGISVGPDGATHQALEDIAILRALPNMTIFSPCDATQARLAAIAAVKDIKGPVYIRYGREAVPDFTQPELGFIPGKAQVLKPGNDIAIFATGHMVWEALQASYALESQHQLTAAVINIHTIKPLDKEVIIHMAKTCGAIVTVEEHQAYGGLGGAMAEVLVTNHPVPTEILGVKDCFGESGKPEELLEKHGLTARGIVEASLKVIQRKKQIP